MKNYKWIGIILSLSLNGCTLPDSQEVVSENLDQLIDSGVKSLSQKTSNFTIFKRPYLKAKKTTEKSRILDMPVRIFSVSDLSVMECLKLIENQYNIPTYFSDYYALSDEQTETLDDKKKVMYEGEFGGFLEYLGNVYGISTELDKHNQVKASYFQTKTYTLDQYIDGNSANASLSLGGGGAGGLSASTSTSVKSDTWDKIQEYLSAVIGDGGSATILQDFSVVKVTARPWVIKEVDNLFERIKRESQMQVAVQYRIIALNKTRLNQLAMKFGVKYQGDDFTIASDLIDAISLSQQGGGLAITKRAVSSRLDAIVQTIGQEVISEGQFVGLPNRVIPINLTTSTAYISEIENQENQDINETTSSVKTAEIKTGLSMLILPKVMDDGRIQLTSGFTEKKLVSLKSLQGVQLPIVDETETLSTVTIDSGNIELIALYTGKTTNRQNGIQLFGGGFENSYDDKIIAVIIGANSYKLASTLAKRG